MTNEEFIAFADQHGNVITNALEIYAREMRESSGRLRRDLESNVKFLADITGEAARLAEAALKAWNVMTVKAAGLESADYRCGYGQARIHALNPSSAVVRCPLPERNDYERGWNAALDDLVPEGSNSS